MCTGVAAYFERFALQKARLLPLRHERHNSLIIRIVSQNRTGLCLLQDPILHFLAHTVLFAVDFWLLHFCGHSGHLLFTAAKSAASRSLSLTISIYPDTFLPASGVSA